jgi:hypothetical protein
VDARTGHHKIKQRLDLSTNSFRWAHHINVISQDGAASTVVAAGKV